MAGHEEGFALEHHGTNVVYILSLYPQLIEGCQPIFVAHFTPHLYSPQFFLKILLLVPPELHMYAHASTTCDDQSSLPSFPSPPKVLKTLPVPKLFFFKRNTVLGMIVTLRLHQNAFHIIKFSCRACLQTPLDDTYIASPQNQDHRQNPDCGQSRISRGGGEKRPRYTLFVRVPSSPSNLHTIYYTEGQFLFTC